MRRQPGRQERRRARLPLRRQEETALDWLLGLQVQKALGGLPGEPPPVVNLVLRVRCGGSVHRHRRDPLV